MNFHSIIIHEELYFNITKIFISLYFYILKIIDKSIFNMEYHQNHYSELFSICNAWF